MVWIIFLALFNCLDIESFMKKRGRAVSSCFSFVLDKIEVLCYARLLNLIELSPQLELSRVLQMS